MSAIFKRLGACLLVATLDLAAGGAGASLLRSMDLAELTHAAEIIVVGAVARTESAWDAQQRTIYSTVEIAVDEAWKGSVPTNGRIRLRHAGGKVGDLEMTVHGEGRFLEGERVLVFVRAGRLVGMGQGKRVLAWDSTAKCWMAAPWDHAGAAVVGRPPTRADSPVSLDALRAQIGSLVGK